MTRHDASSSQAVYSRSPSMRRLLAMAERVAPLDSTVLITGETGVGKERLARWLHDASPRAGRPFVTLNCAALSDDLLESELCGHVRGAFTGAVTDHVGIVEAAHGGTLFLDEIGDITAAMQVQLLRIVQEREVKRLGEIRTRSVDVRLIAATNRDLVEEVAERRFREDLLYRLRVIELHIPPLRERPEDLLDLANDILRQTSARLDCPFRSFTTGAVDWLLQYQWPGNIRELEHVIERACVLATGPEIAVEDLPDTALDGTSAPKDASRPLRERERAYVQAVVARHPRNRRAAAQELGISLSTLTRRLRAQRAD